MDMNDADDEEFGFSRNYFLAKELGGSAVKSHSKLSDINIVDEQVRPAFNSFKISHQISLLFVKVWNFGICLWNGQELREALSNIEPKHEKEIEDLLSSYKSLYPRWAFDLRYEFALYIDQSSFAKCYLNKDCLEWLWFSSDLNLMLDS